MKHTLQSFARESHTLLAGANTPATRARLAERLRQALSDEEFVRPLFSGEPSERRIVYQDAELGFCILAHDYSGPKDSGPHDHGTSWAIYGQAAGETQMSDFDVVQAAGAETPGQVRRTSTYTLKPGDVHVYNEGAIHAPSRKGPTRLVRIEGTNLEKVKRARYEVVA
ncbi:MAG: hypothetical protein HY854_09610 [Burkholderiales bacterium]|nr:hypothetical protein [Burkholderiales bacterium]